MDEKFPLQIREATAADVPHLVWLVKQLAEYEKLENQMVATEELFKRNGFGEYSYYKALLAQTEEEIGYRYIGFALYFFTFSTFLGKPTLYLEDLFVLPEFRGRGVGKQLLKQLAQIAVQRECGRMEWSVLNWNESAIHFYVELGAKAMEEWTLYRLHLPEIEKLALS